MTAATHPVDCSGAAAVRGAHATVALLEAAAIALGAPAMGEPVIRAARRADRDLRSCQDDYAAAHLARRFHHTLLDACPNRHMVELAAAESGALLLPAIRVGVDEVNRIADDHDAILDLIAGGAPRCAIEMALRAHASTSRLCVLAPGMDPGSHRDERPTRP